MSKLRVGLIGLGMMGRNHARVLSNLSGIDFVGVSDPLANVEIAEKYPDLNVYEEYNELLKQQIDYCVIAAPTGFHKDIAISALNKGIHCLIEKPVATSYEEAMLIREVSTKKSLIVGIGHIERYNSAIRQLKIRIRNGELGEIYQISMRRIGPFPARIADVGVIKDLATHDLDLAMWLSDSKFDSLAAETAHRSGRTHEDLVSISGLLKNKIVVNILVNWLSPLKERSLVVTGEKGAFVVDTLNSDLIFYENGQHIISQDSLSNFKGVTQGNITNFAFDRPEPLLVEHENFRDKILGIESDIVTLDEGIETVRVADAAIVSSKNRKIIEL